MNTFYGTDLVGACHFGTKFEEILIKIGMKMEEYGKEW
jgi:hypothetical protein